MSITPLSAVRLRLLLPLAFLLLPACSATGENLPPAVDLQADGRAASAERLPVVLFFYTANCPFCREVEEQYLEPLMRENKTSPRLILRTVEIDKPRPLVDFSGQGTDMRAFAKQQGVTLVPHLRFLGPDGTPLAPDLLGLSSRDFYAGYLEDSIDSATGKLRGK